jgi:hypothetical protein
MQYPIIRPTPMLFQGGFSEIKSNLANIALFATKGSMIT